jgi:hypothetical protein
MRKVLIFMLITVLFLPAWAFASGLCCQLSSGVQEGLLGAATPGEHKISLQLTYSYTEMNKLREGAHERSVEDVKNAGVYTSIPTDMDMIKYTLTAGYGLSPRFKVFASFPFVRNTMDMTHKMMGEWMDMSMDPVEGLGDITLMGLYRVWADRELRPSQSFSVAAGVKLPTGDYTKKNSNGKLIHAHMQPGTGSWDPIFSVIYTRMGPSLLMQADLTYQLTTENSKGYEFGDSFAANLSAKYALSRFFNITGDVIYLNTGKSSDEDLAYFKPGSLEDDPENTGGQSIWLSPGIEIMPVKNLSLGFKYQFPAWEDVNGIQLVSTSRILTSLSYTF